MLNTLSYQFNIISTSFKHGWSQLCEDDTLGVPKIEP